MCSSCSRCWNQTREWILLGTPNMRFNKPVDSANCTCIILEWNIYSQETSRLCSYLASVIPPLFHKLATWSSVDTIHRAFCLEGQTGKWQWHPAPCSIVGPVASRGRFTSLFAGLSRDDCHGSSSDFLLKKQELELITSKNSYIWYRGILGAIIKPSPKSIFSKSAFNYEPLHDKTRSSHRLDVDAHI